MSNSKCKKHHETLKRRVYVIFYIVVIAQHILVGFMASYFPRCHLFQKLDYLTREFLVRKIDKTCV